MQFIEEEIEVNTITVAGVGNDVWHIPHIKNKNIALKNGKGVDIYILDTGE